MKSFFLLIAIVFLFSLGANSQLLTSPRTITEDEVLMTGSGALKVPSGTTGLRPSTPLEGMIRFNTTTGKFEQYVSSNWVNPLDKNIFGDDEFEVVNGVDGTKKIKLDASSITTGNERTLTAQDASGTITLLESDQTFTGTNTFNNGVLMVGNGSFTMPVGTSAQRPGIASTGMQRYNTTLNLPEVYNGSAWVPLNAANSITGPGVSTDTAAVVFDGASGKLARDSSLLIDADGRLSQPDLSTSSYVGEGAGVNDDLTNNSNTGLGFEALNDVVTGAGNTAVGSGSASSLTGDNNVAIGSDALKVNTSGDNNVAVGAKALSSSTMVSSSNTAVGANSQRLSTTASRNTAIGTSSLENNIQGQRNTAIGHNAGRNALASDNTIIGANAGSSVTGGNMGENTFIGSSAGDSITTGERNILIGYDADAPSSVSNDRLNIGNTLYADMANELLGVNKANPTVALDVLGDGKFSGQLDVSGDLTASTITTVGDIVAGGTGQIQVPSGTTAQRDPAPESGQIRYNTDDTQFEGYNGVAWTPLGQGAGNSGDVAGPVAGTDNAMVRFDGITGKTIQDSVIIVDDLGEIGGVTTLNAERLLVENTTRGSHPCPDMTEIQRDAIVTPEVGDCIINLDSNIMDIWDGTQWIAAGAAGDVFGPGASTDNALTRWNGTTGFEIQDSNILLDDSDNMTGINTLDVASITSTSTTMASHPCPTMTETQRDLLTPSVGDCVINSDTNTQNNYGGSAWIQVGDLIGSGVSTANGVAVYSDTGGLIIKSTSATVDGSGNFVTSGNVSAVDITASGDLVADTITGDITVDNLVAGTNDFILTSDAGVSTWKAAPVSTTLDTKGDIQTFDTANAKLPVGANGQILNADSAEATGLKWIDVPVSTTLTAKGDIQTFDTANAALGVGTDGQLLTADSGESTGLKWTTPPPSDMQGAYEASTSPQIMLNGTQSGVSISDNDTVPLGGPLFSILSTDQLTAYFTITAEGLTLDATGETVDTILDEDDMFSNDPNALATQQSIKNFVEFKTGNVSPSYNMLKNPSYEYSSLGFGVCSGCFAGGQNTGPTSLKFPRNDRYLSIDAGVSAWTYTEEIDHSIQLKGTQGYFEVWLKADYAVPDVQLAMVIDGVEGTLIGTDKLELKPYTGGDLKWNKYELPFIFGESSAGFRITNPNAVSRTVKVDNAKLGIAPEGYISNVDVVSEWQADTGFSVLNLGTSSTLFKTRQVGDTLEVTGKITFDGSGIGSLYVKMDKYTIDASKIDFTGAFTSMGYGSMNDGDAAAYFIRPTYDPTLNQIRFRYESAVSASTGTVTSSVPFAIASGDILDFTASIPVNELSASPNTLVGQKTSSPDEAGFLQLSFNDGTLEGFEVADGGCVLKSKYPDYVRRMSSKYASCTITVADDGILKPDARGYFFRGLDNMGTGAASRDVDGTARTVGQTQTDQFKSHNHTINRSNSSGHSTTQTDQIADNATSIAGITNSNLSGGTETRGKNIAVMAYVRMVDRDILIGKFNQTSIAKDEDKYTETEKKWGFWKGEQLYRRCFTVANDVATSGVIAAWVTGLKIKNAIHRTGNKWTLQGVEEGANRAIIDYLDDTGNIEATVSTLRVAADTSICAEYTK